MKTNRTQNTGKFKYFSQFLLNGVLVEYQYTTVQQQCHVGRANKENHSLLIPMTVSHTLVIDKFYKYKEKKITTHIWVRVSF